MKVISGKPKVSIILILSMLLFSACSNTEESQKEKNTDSLNNHEVTEKEEQEEQIPTDEDTDNNLSNLDYETGIPMSEFLITKMPIESIFLISDMDIDSSFEKEVIETLSEFNAVETEDGTKLTLPEDILFDFDSAELRSGAGKAIDQLVQLIETTDDEVTIVGHTDSKGEDSYNQELSEDRANAVLDALADEGVEKDRIIAEGRGPTEPVAENTKSDGSDHPDGRQKNRRVEVTVHGFNQ